MSEGTGATGEPVRAGDLLVATPSLLDPNFERTVVLVLDVTDGALGVVLNRPSPVPVGDVLPDWQELTGPPGVLFQGGPVGTDSALAVGVRDTPPAPGEDDEPLGFRLLYGRVGIVDLDSPTAVVAPALSHLRIFAGYAGWGRDQLEAEIRTGSWYVVPSLPSDLSAADPQTLWKRVLRRQPGELAWVSTRPVDPTLN
jgi:putative transcriptional regulator